MRAIMPNREPEQPLCVCGWRLALDGWMDTGEVGRVRHT